MDTVGIVPTGVNSIGKMSGNIDFYYMPTSPPCRTVMIVAKAVGVNLNLKMINVLEGENLTPEFLKINPEHCIPTLDDNGLVLWESRAIMCYLANMYDKEGELYPKDPRKRALVDQKLYFDACTLYGRLFAYFLPVIRQGQEPNKEKKELCEDALNTLNNSLKKSKWVAGDTMTLADIAIVVTVSSAEVMNIDIKKYSNIMNWYEKCKTEMAKYDYEELNEKPLMMMAQFFKGKFD